MENRNNFDKSKTISSEVQKDQVVEISSHSETIASGIIEKLISYSISEIIAKGQKILIPSYSIDYIIKTLNEICSLRHICFEQDEHYRIKMEERLRFNSPFFGVNDWSVNIEPVT